MCVGTNGDAESPPETKISDLDGPLVVDEKVLWFQVAVDDTTRVHEDDAL